MTQVPPSMPPPMPLQPYPDGTGAPKPSGRGLAIAALVLGILAILPGLGMLLGLVAIVLAIVSLATKRQGTSMAIIGLILGVVLPIVGLTMFIVPTLGRARELARQAACQASLNAVGKAVVMYQATYNEAYPADLDLLVSDNMISEEAFQCPSEGQRRGPRDYFYFPPTNTTSPGQTIMATELHRFHKDGRTVLRVDSSVNFLKGNAFEAELAKPENAAFAKAFRDAGGN